MSSVVDWCHEKQEEEDYQHKVSQVKNRLHIQESASSANAAPDPQWSPEIPTKPGFYWFHGTSRNEREVWRYVGGEGYRYIPRDKPVRPYSRAIKVVQNGEHVEYFNEKGSFDPTISGYEGQWLKFDPPTPPKKSRKGP